MIVLYNPHVDDFLAAPPHFRFLGRRPLKKYGFFISESLKRQVPLKVLVDATMSAFVPERIFGSMPALFRQVISSIEFRLWVRLNGLDGRVEQLAKPRQPVQDVLLAFSYKAATGPFHLRREVFARHKSVVFHLSHYFTSTSEKACNIAAVPNAWLAGDSDITNNDYFQRFFSWYARPFLVMPFAVDERFYQKLDWDAKEPKCVATGSFHDLTKEAPARKYRDFMTSTGSTTYHPLRKEIYEESAKLNAWFECRVSPFRAIGKNSRWSRSINRFKVSQKKYFSIDISELYDSYRYAVVGEELSGFPALGAFEAMACGCVLLADQQAYEGLRIEPGVHYIAHDGTLNGIKALIENASYDYVQLSSEGRKFIEVNMRPPSVFSLWLAALEFASIS